MSNTKVFIAGSRKLSKLNKRVLNRLDRIIANGFTIIVGDANGMDKAVQAYVNGKHYSNVTVFCMENACRNNLGEWRVKEIGASDPSRRDFSFYSTKDKAMADEADYGLMLWDGKSRGTLANILNLVHRGKPAVVYVAANKTFYTLRGASNLMNMLSVVAPEMVRSVSIQLDLSHQDSPSVRPDPDMLF
jgi:hypothetical protein